MHVKFLAPLLSGVLLCGTPAMIGCSRDEGALEDVGESIDEATEEVKDEIDDATTN